jgi:hypothetical protein
MIGKVMVGKSFGGCISYCLEDKRTLSEEQKAQLSQEDGVQHKNRAEVLEYNFCFGDKHELSDQFKDVRRLNKNVEKPVFHLAIRLAQGDKLTHEQWREVARGAAKEFKFDRNQYICILHKDTQQPHIHIVANRGAMMERPPTIPIAICEWRSFVAGWRSSITSRKCLAPAVFFLPRNGKSLVKTNGKSG